MEDKLTILLRLFKEDKITQEEFKILSVENIKPTITWPDTHTPIGPKIIDWTDRPPYQGGDFIPTFYPTTC
mgnify:CR=1 FL=1